MARIENHYNVIAIVFDMSDFDSTLETFVMTDDLREEYFNMIAESEYTLIPVALFPGSPRMTNCLFYTSIEEDHSAIHFANGDVQLTVSITGGDGGGGGA